MPFTALEIKAELAGLTGLSLPYHTRLHCTVKCLGCGNENENIWIDRQEEFELEKRGTAHVVAKCKLCERSYNISILDWPTEDYPQYNEENNGEWLALAYFDQRGCEIQTVHADCLSFSVKGSETSTVFEDVVLTEDWYEFDEKQDSEVSILEFETRFVKVDKLPKLKAQDGEDGEDKDDGGKKGGKGGKKK